MTFDNAVLPGTDIHVNPSYIGLGQQDVTGLTFWLATGIMLASTIFFFLERFSVPMKWRTSMTLAGLVTGVAFWNYVFMREAWLMTMMSPTVYRYTDWLITVPLQICEFYFILKAGTEVSVGVFWKLMVSSVLMLVFGYLGEAFIAPFFLSWILGMVAWLYIIYEIFYGECSQLNAKASASTQAAFTTIRNIVTIGWVIYPIGYLCGLIHGPTAGCWVNGIYNVADLVNKTAFGLAIYSAAKMDVSPSDYAALA